MIRLKPLLVFDGDCDFCKYFVEKWQAKTKDKIEYKPYQDVAKEFPQIDLLEFQKSVHLIETDGTIFKAGEAVFRIMDYASSRSPKNKWLWAYQHIPGIRMATELGYKTVAQNRNFFSKFID